MVSSNLTELNRANSKNEATKAAGGASRSFVSWPKTREFGRKTEKDRASLWCPLFAAAVSCGVGVNPCPREVNYLK